MNQDMAVGSLADFIYGRAPNPVVCGRGVSIGSGAVIPEINFTLPSMGVSDSTWPEVRRNYQEMIDGVLQRAAELSAPEVLVEFETLPEMTIRPGWGLDITRLLADAMGRFEEKHGLRTALRLTPNDVREFARPPIMRRGEYWECMQEFFAGAGAAGADLISIESTGGKELSDDALLNGDLRKAIFALGVLGSRDMAFLWGHIVGACRAQGIVPAGDSACGFANTAMVLAEKNMIPRVFAAMVRVASVPRSLVAVTEGAVGPSKDCAYEGPYLKALAGIPISMEGKCAACAHFSPIGNIAQAVCDCWSNESVQNVQLLSGRAPVVSMEQLVYDCRLMNIAAKTPGGAAQLRDWLSDSDSGLDVQAYVLRPDVVLRLASTIVGESDPYRQTLILCEAALNELRDGVARGAVRLADREMPWLDIMQMALEECPASGEALAEQVLAEIGEGVFLPEEYGL